MILTIAFCTLFACTLQLFRLCLIINTFLRGKLHNEGFFSYLKARDLTICFCFYAHNENLATLLTWLFDACM